MGGKEQHARIADGIGVGRFPFFSHLAVLINLKPCKNRLRRAIPMISKVKLRKPVLRRGSIIDLLLNLADLRAIQRLDSPLVIHRAGAQGKEQRKKYRKHSLHMLFLPMLLSS